MVPVFWMRVGRALLHAALPGAIVGLGIAAGQQSETPVFRTDTRLVEIEVRVTDKNGKPVRGLSREDFTVRENGQAQVCGQTVGLRDAGRAGGRATRAFVFDCCLSLGYRGRPADLDLHRNRSWTVRFRSRLPAGEYTVVVMLPNPDDQPVPQIAETFALVNNQASR